MKKLAAYLLPMILAAVLLPASAGKATPAAAAAPQSASFDYSMPDRFGRDDNGDGLIDYYVPTVHCVSGTGRCDNVPATSPLPISPSSWTVNLNACASEPGGGVQVTYSWRDIDNVGVTFSGGPGCNQFVATVPRLSTYRIGLTAASANGTATVVQQVMVKDLLIVSMGDSYGSGEGNPDVYQVFTIDSIVPLSFTYSEAKWQDRRCHRSSLSGSAQAALELERADPHTSVTFVQTSCSGATMVQDPMKPVGDTSTGGILSPYNGAESPEQEATLNGVIAPIRPQVEQVHDLLLGSNRAIDALYVSVGGNDSYFAPIVISCLALEPCNPVAQGWPDTTWPSVGIVGTTCLAVFLFVPPPFDVIAYPVCLVGLGIFVASFAGTTAEHWFQNGFYGAEADLADPATWRISSLYGQLQSNVFGPGGIMFGRDSHSLFLSEYVDATKNDNGSYCPAGILDIGRNMRLPGVTEGEFSWLDTQVEQVLSGAIQYNATTHGWTFVDGVSNAFQRHGACADDAWLVGLVPETFLKQGNKSGAVHPNIWGHRAYRNRILERWLPYLWPAHNGEEPWIPGNLMGSPRTYIQDWIADHPLRQAEKPPVANPGGPYTVVEGATVTAVNDSWDANDDSFTSQWSSGNANIATVSPATAPTPTITGIDDGVTSLSLSVTDNDGTATASAAVTVTNANPVATITAAGDGSGVTLPLVAVPLTASFTDAGKNDTHTATVDWGDGTPIVTATITESNGSGTVAVAAHAYAAPGARTITVKVTDDDGGIGTATKTVTVVTGAQAMGDVLTDLRAIAADASQPTAVRAAAAQAVVLLDGLRDGLANNGSLDKLLDGDDAAALLKLREVIAVLVAIPEASRPASMTQDTYALVRVAESVARSHYDAAVAALVAPTPAQVTELNAIGNLLAAGRQAITNQQLLTAVDDFLEALRRSDGLLK